MKPEEIKARIEGTRASLEAKKPEEAQADQREERRAQEYLTPSIESPNAVTLEGEIVSSGGVKSGISSASLSRFTMALKRGGSMRGELQLTFLNEGFLSSLSRIDDDRNSKKYKVTINIETL